MIRHQILGTVLALAAGTSQASIERGDWHNYLDDGIDCLSVEGQSVNIEGHGARMDSEYGVAGLHDGILEVTH